MLIVLKRPLLYLLMSSTLLADNNQLDMLDDLFALNLENLQNISVNSVSKMNQPLKDAPANMIVFTQEQIEKRGFRNVSDLLSTLPGVTIHNFSTSGYFNAINIRGMNGAQYFKILLDGIEIDSTNGERISTAMNFPLNGIARAEILYGAASVVYGADAVSGVINLVTQEQSGQEIFVSTGPDGYNYSYLRYAQKIADFKFVVRGHIHEDQEYNLDERYPQHFPFADISNNAGEIVQPAEYRTFDYKPSSTKSINFLLKNESFDFGINYSSTTDSILIGQVDKKSKQNLFDPNANITTSILGAYSKYNFSYEDILFTSTLSYDRTTVEEGSYFINRNTDYKKAYKYSRSERYKFEQLAEIEYSRHKLVAGFTYEKFNSMPMSFDLPTPSPSDDYTYPGSDIPINYFRHSWENTALFLQDYYTLNEVWKFSLALRYDHNTIEGNIVNPRIAMIYQPTSDYTHKLIYSEAYLSPSMTNKYKHFGLPLELNDIEGDTNKYKTDYFRVPNENLEAENSQSIEYSFFAKLPQNIFLQTSFYYTKLENLIGERELENVTDATEDVTVLRATQIYNSGKGIIHGFDISLNYRDSLYGVESEFWGNYSYIGGYMETEIKNELPFIAPHQINAGVLLSWQRWSFSPSLKWIKEINSGYLPDESGDREKIDGYTQVDFFTTYKFNAYVLAGLDINNLLDTDYYNARDGFSSTYQVPQLGRNFIFSLKAVF